MKKIEFSFICDKKFDDLEGEDNRKRFCQDCHKDVFNLDVMSNAERKKLSDNAAKAGLSLCVSVTQRERVKARPCSADIFLPDSFLSTARVGGIKPLSVGENKLSKKEAQQLKELFAKAYKEFSQKP